MAAGFTRLGHQVCGCGRDEKALRSLAAELRPGFRGERVDVASDREVAAWAPNVLADFGVPDLLINNAAIFNPNATLWETTAADFDHVLAVRRC